jgi:hypothetical protein
LGLPQLGVSLPCNLYYSGRRFKVSSFLFLLYTPPCRIFAIFPLEARLVYF